MRRREFITLVAGAMVEWPLAVGAQEAGRIYRIGVLSFLPRISPHYVALFDELSHLGFVQNKNLFIDDRGFSVKVDKVPQIAVELVDAKVDVILSGGDFLIHAVQQATTKIPILATTDDMIATGLVRSLSNPGGNTTGVSIFATELDGKRQELLKELLPEARHMAALADSHTTATKQLDSLKTAAALRGVDLSIYPVTTADEIAPAIEVAKNSGATALNVLASALFYANRRDIFSQVAMLRLPAIYQWPDMAEEGGLLAYGPRFAQIYKQQISRQLVKILQGIKPADIPVEQPSDFELIINLKTAKGLGLTVPSTLFNRATNVIE
jgi:putative ABC transport system substrate-binding protein